MANHQRTKEFMFHPIWMLLSVTFPQVVLFLMIYSSFSVFSSLLSAEQIMLWRSFAVSFLILMGVTSLYCCGQFFKKRQVHVLVSPAILMTYIPFLYIYIIHFEDLINFNIPEWMVSSTDLALLYPGTFLMPAFIYALSIAIVALTPLKNRKRAIPNLIGAALIPLAWYGFFTLILPLFRNVRMDFSYHVPSVLLIGSALIFFFLLFRFFYLIIVRNKRGAMHLNPFWRVFFSLILPLTGLIVYEHILPRMYTFLSREAHSVIGDFSHPLFLILAVINGLALSVPDFPNLTIRKLLFGLRMLCFPFTIYFCLVFLPFLPLSLVVILFFGLGLLMSAPVFLVFLQCRILLNDFKFLLSQNSKTYAIALLVPALLVLPAGITWNFILDRTTLHHALEYTFESKQTASLNRDRLQKILDKLEYRQDKIPFISQYYKWLVLDNMQLSRSKVAMLQKVFFNKGKGIASQSKTVKGNRSVAISAVHHRTVWEEESATFRSNIELVLKNESRSMAEFATDFELPAGVWVNDYFLVIDGEKVHGRLMEKKAALWIYRQIKKHKRDPGLVYYVNENRPALHVFPINSGETRRTGFELIHKEPFRFMLDNKKLELGFRQAKKAGLNPINFPFVAPNGRAVFASKAAKKQLPLVQRNPYLHFVLDYSESCGLFKSNYKNKIERLALEKKLNMNFAKVTFANHTAKTTFWQDTSKEKLTTYPCEGGFFLDKAIKSILINQHRSMSLVYPVIIVISPDLDNAVLPGRLDHYRFAVPETDFYYEMTANGELEAHALFADSKNHSFTDKKPLVRVWPSLNNPKAFFSNDDNPSLALIPERLVQSQSSETIDQWTSGLTLWGLTKQQLFDSNAEHTWKHLAELSKQKNILNPYTAFTVLENQAQWEVLKRKEKTALGAGKSLEMGDDDQDFSRMAEPPIGLVLVGLLLFGLLRWKLGKTQLGILERGRSKI